jgi:chromosome segregation ATPase
MRRPSRSQRSRRAKQQQGADAAKALGDLQAKIQAAQAQADNATGDRDKVLAAVANAKSRLTDLQQQSDAVEKSLTALQQQGADAAKALADLQQQGVDAAKTLEDLQAKIQAAQKALDASKSQ